MNNLTTIAALPQAGGCMSSLPAERNDGWDGITSEPPKVQVKAEEPDTIEELCAKYLAAHEGLVE